MKRGKWLMVLVIVGILFCTGWKALGMTERLNSLELLRSLVEEESLLLQAELEAGDIHISCDFFRQELEGEALLGLTTMGHTFYFWKDCLYLDNGRGYDLEELLPDALDGWQKYLPALLLTEITYTKTDSGVSAQFRITERQARNLAKWIPEGAEWADALREATLSIISDAEGIREVVLSGGFGVLRGVVLREEPPKADTALLMEMKAGGAIPVHRILPLVRGCLALMQYDTVGAEADLELSCGLLPIRDRAELYYTKGALLLVRGGKGFRLKLSGEESGAALFPAIGYLMLRDGEYLPQEDGLEVRLTIPADQVKALFDQLLPEAAGLGLQFEKAEAVLRTEGDRLIALCLDCKGDMPFLITRIPIGFSMDLTFPEHPVTLPDAAREALSRG